MKNLIMIMMLSLSISGCAVPLKIRQALEAQSEYTNIYMEKTMALLRNSDHPEKHELLGIGMRLVRNAKSLEDWSKGLISRSQSSGQND